MDERYIQVDVQRRGYETGNCKSNQTKNRFERVLGSAEW